MYFPLTIAKATPQLQAAIELIDQLLKAGFETYLAGGWVRDLWLKRPNCDIDIATAAPLEALQRLFPSAISVGASFGCLIVSVGPWQFEVTTFRKEGKYLDGRHPTSIEAGSAKDDALRRDFTINGLFYDIKTERIIDFVKGVEHLTHGQVCSIGDPRLRFDEDKLRLLRCARFAAQLDFSIEKSTKNAVLELADQLCSAVSKERIWQELTKLFSGLQSVRGCSLLYELNLAKALAPALPPLTSRNSQTICQLKRLSVQTPLIYRLLSLWTTAGNPLQLSASPDEIAAGFRSLFPLSRQDQRRMDLWLAMQQLALCLDVSAKRYQWCALYSHQMADECTKALWPLFAKEQRGRQIELYRELIPHIERMRARRPLVNAALLQTLGIAPGPKMGHLLHRGEILAVELDLKTPEQVLEHLLKGS